MLGVASKDSRNSGVATRQAEMKFYRLVLGVLAVWGITRLLHAEDGPWDLVVHLRRSAGDGFWGKVAGLLLLPQLMGGGAGGNHARFNRGGVPYYGLPFRLAVVCYNESTNRREDVPRAQFTEDTIGRK
jgi:hypothetical protein